MNIYKIILVLFLFSISTLFAEKSFTKKLGKGIINHTDKDSAFSIKTNLEIYPRLSIKNDIDTPDFVEGEAIVRRIRLKFRGFILNPKVSYFVHLGFSNKDIQSNRKPDSDNPGNLFDAFIKWEFMPQTSILFGQAKLPANLSRTMSFTKLNFMERSFAESRFTPYRDIGFQLHNEFEVGQIIFREAFAISNGEGRNFESIGQGYAFTGRFETLPFGDFTGKGQYCEMDIYREKTPKLSLGAAFVYNDNSQRNRSLLGAEISEPTDIKSFMADILFKYNGFAFLSEYYNMRSDDLFSTDQNDETPLYIFNADGFSAQASYMINNKMSFAFRYCYVNPVEELEKLIDKRQDFSLGHNYYFSGNNFKLTTELLYSTIERPNVETQEELWLMLQLAMIL